MSLDLRISKVGDIDVIFNLKDILSIIRNRPILDEKGKAIADDNKNTRRWTTEEIGKHLRTKEPRIKDRALVEMFTCKKANYIYRTAREYFRIYIVRYIARDR